MKENGKVLLNQLSEHVNSVEARAILQAEINEMRSNLVLLEKIKEGKINLDEEIAELIGPLAESLRGEPLCHRAPGLGTVCHNFCGFSSSP